MRKLLLAALIVALLVPGLAYAANRTTAYPGAIRVDGHNELGQPPQYVMKVRYSVQGANQTKIASGDVVLWDNTSGDGVSVYKVADGQRNVAVSSDVRFAGIAVSDILTNDSSSITDYNPGDICVGGYCLASLDTAVDVSSAQGEIGLGVAAGTGGLVPIDSTNNSQDVGIALQDSTVGINSPVWIWRR